MGIFDGLPNPAAPGMAFQQGMDRGRAEREDRETKGALSAYAMNPDDPEAFKKLAQWRPDIAISVREDRSRQQQEARGQQRNDLPVIARLLEGVQDEPSYQQALAAAQRYGIDISDAPPAFDPQWREQTLMLAQAAQTPQGQEAISNAGKQAVDAGFQPGTPEFSDAVRKIVTASMAQPFTGAQGETRLYTPDPFGGGGQVQGVPFDPNEWEIVEQGDAGGNASGGFRP